MTTPGDKLTEFSARWNDLRNAVIGRGVQPPPGVSAELAARVGNTYTRWRAYLAQMPAPMVLLPAQALADWLPQYRELVQEARAAGLRFRVLPRGWTDAVKRTAGGGYTWKTWAVISAVFAVPVLCMLGSGGRRR